MKRFISLILAIFLLIPLTSCKLSETEPSERFSREVDANEIAISSEHFSLTMAEVSYEFGRLYSDFKMNYSESVDMYNIDTGSSLKDQIYYDDHSWFDEFSDQTISYLTDMLYYCEGAYDAGIELDDEDNKMIEETIASWNDYAEDYDVTIAKLMKTYFSLDVTLEVMQSYLEKEALAEKYQKHLASQYDFTEEELSEYLENNPDDYYYVDYMYFTFDEVDGVDADAEERATALSKVDNTDEFTEVIKDYLSTVKDLPEDEMELEKYTITYANKTAATKTDEGFASFAFSKSTKEGDTYIKSQNVDGKYTVYLITKTSYLQEDTIKIMYYIDAFKSSHNNNVESTKAYLQGLIDTWQNSENNTGADFAQMAYEKSEDSASALEGGYVYGVLRSDYSTYSKELISWLYDEEHSEGDTSVIRGGNSDYYAVYFIGSDMVGWQYQVTQTLLTQKSQEVYNELKSKYTITVDQEVIDGADF